MSKQSPREEAFMVGTILYFGTGLMAVTFLAAVGGWEPTLAEAAAVNLFWPVFGLKYLVVGVVLILEAAFHLLFGV